jgi:hypothetical protein
LFEPFDGALTMGYNVIVMTTRQKNSFGMGAFVGVPFFLLIYFGQMFGPMNLIGSLGTAFGCSFGVAMCTYVLAKPRSE